MAAGAKSFSKTFVWIILALLIVGLAGFGATNLTGTVHTVGRAGDETISVDDFAREMQREMRAVEAQTGQPLPMSQAQSLGLDQVVLSRLVSLASLDNEVAQLGLSIGDENLQKEIIQIPAFQGIDGQFDRESYRFSLDNAGLNEAEFEDDLRAESARTLVQSAIMAGTEMPEVLTETMINYVAARRNFTWAQLGPDALEAEVPTPTEAELRSYYDENIDDFSLPETKQLTYALLTPEMILDQVKIEESALQDLYDSRSAEYDIAERRLVERLAFADMATASSAKAQLDVGGTTFEALVEQRGLALTDIDLGDVTREDLRQAADDVFAAETGDVVGPLPSDLGPALYRVNGTLAARQTAFEDVETELRAELAGDRARRLIETQAEDINDLLAGGVTLEELADETDMEVGEVAWTTDLHEGIAAYEDFRAAAEAVTEDDFPEITLTEDGAIFALRLESELPVRPEPFETAQAKVAEAWTAKETLRLLTEQAESLVPALEETGDFTATGLPFRVENSMTRTAFVDGTPADFMSQVFEMEKDEIRVIPGEGSALIVQVTDMLPPQENQELIAMQNALGNGLDQSLSEALFQAYMRDAQLRARPQIDQNALNAVLTSFQ